jgi:hypothetical protein
MTQPRTATADIVDELRRLADTNRGHRVSCNSELIDLSANRLAEQESTIRHLRLEICNASAILMTHLETIKTIQAEVDLLNKRPKR